MRILSYKHFRLLSNYSENLLFGKKKTFVFITDYPLLIRVGRKEYVIQRDQLGIFNNFQLTNNTSREINLRGVLIQLEESICTNIYDKKGNETIYQAFLDLISGTKASKDLFTSSLKDFLIQSKDSKKNIQTTTTPIDTRLIKVYRFIRQNYHLSITLNNLAELVETNPVYLCNCYSKVFKIPPMNHLLKLRMEKAKDYLISSELSVKEIASKIGYVSCSQFSVYFKKIVGTTPLEYRRTHKKSNISL